LRLALARGLGARRARRLIRDCNGKVPWQSPHKAPERWHDALQAAASVDAASILRACEQQQVELLHPDDPRWPPCCEASEDAPLVLFARGRLELLAQGVRVAIVGARAPLPEAAMLTRAWTEALISAGATIVAAVERGINEATLRAAGSNCIAVLAGGHGKLAASGQRLAKSVFDAGGVVISALPPHASPTKPAFLQRNLLLALFGDLLLVVQAAEGSGALLVAEWAAQLGKEVCVVPGPAWSQAFAGSHALIRSGAMLVDAPEQLLEVLGLQRDANATRSHFQPRNEEEARVLAALAEQPLHLDALAERTALTWQQLAPILLALEMAGAIERLPGDRYALSQGGPHR